MYSSGSGFALGVSSTQAYSYAYPKRIDLGRDRSVVSVACGGQHCCAVTDIGQVSFSLLTHCRATSLEHTVIRHSTQTLKSPCVLVSSR
jgi:Regulator of chromosome condensation (RCC1) repeat